MKEEVVLHLKVFLKERRTNTTLDTYRIGIRCEDYNTILYFNYISTSIAIIQ
jgi:hypothetical protein